MNKYMEDKLQARINCINRANKLANDLYEKIAPIFSLYMGKAVYNITSFLKKNIKDKLPILEYANFVQCCYHYSNYSISIGICAMEEVKQSNCHESHTTDLYIGKVDNCILTEIFDHPNFRTDYTFEEVTEKGTEYENAKVKYEQAKSRLYPFEGYF